MTDPVPYEQQPDLIRVGDAERQQAVTALGEHFAAGRLDQEEFDTRVRTAYAARTRVDLRGLFTDLPEPAPFRPEPAPGFRAGREARERRPERRFAPPMPLFPIVIVAAIVASAVLRFPVFPIVLILWFGFFRRAWR
jgi:hypothetical protein